MVVTNNDTAIFIFLFFTAPLQQLETANQSLKSYFPSQTSVTTGKSHKNLGGKSSRTPNCFPRKIPPPFPACLNMLRIDTLGFWSINTPSGDRAILCCPFLPFHVCSRRSCVVILCRHVTLNQMRDQSLQMSQVVTYDRFRSRNEESCQ